MRVSVVVPTYRRPDLLDRCLAALARQRLAPKPRPVVAVCGDSRNATEGVPYSVEDASYEVIVADDSGGDEPTRRVVERAAAPHARFRYLPVPGPHHGPAAARNAGWQMAQGEIIAFTDDDCIPDSVWLAAGLAPFDNNQVVAVTGQTVVPLPPEPTDYERDAAGLERAEFVTANCFVRRHVLAAIGGFDEAFTAAWREDSDLQFRLLDCGGLVVKAPDAVVVHPVRPAPWGISLKQQKKIRFDALLYRKHPQRFRERIGPGWPWHYYLIVAAVALALGSFIAGRPNLGGAALAVWFLFTFRFFTRRLYGTARTASHIAEMLVTSLAIPFVAVFWRLYGAIRYRVLFW